LTKRSSIAREAARLLYSGVIEEYINAKEVAAASLNVSVFPSNYEVAEELDRLTDELEGAERLQRLVEMRRSALNIMNKLQNYSPRLIGSVWRGTVRKGSDVDIIAFSNDHIKVETALINSKIIGKGEVTFKGGIHAYHFILNLGDYKGEVVVRNPAGFVEERCDIYGDIKQGLNSLELERLLRVDPLRRFVPKRRSR
jgi:predicted nucleotidyltransferase